MQLQVQSNPLKGFWLVSGAAFLVAPFLTNDGVCLLFVELILDAFEATKALSNNSIVANACTTEDREKIIKLKEMPLETGDAIYFLLTLACSANIGSALTYTGLSGHYLRLSTHGITRFNYSLINFLTTCLGNPQNMIVAQDATDVMPPLKFLAVMLLPSTAAWLLSEYDCNSTTILANGDF